MSSITTLGMTNSAVTVLAQLLLQTEATGGPVGNSADLHRG